MFEIFKNEKFSITFSFVILAASIASIIFDFLTPNDFYWFQRSGALIVLAGVELQYSNLMSVWKKAVEREKNIESVVSRIASAKGIGMKELAEESEKTRAFALRIHETVTSKSTKEVFAVAFIIAGTVIWGYGDLPFK